jgi:hypothetical protein
MNSPHFPIGVRAQPGFQKPANVPSLACATRTTSGIVPGNLPPRINSSSCACSSAEDSGHSTARNRANSSTSDGCAGLTRVSLIPPSYCNSLAANPRSVSSISHGPASTRSGPLSVTGEGLDRVGVLIPVPFSTFNCQPPHACQSQVTCHQSLAGRILQAAFEGVPYV